MPVPNSKSVGVQLTFFKRDKPGWTHERQLAAALNEARAHGASIPLPPKKRNK